MPIFEYKAKKKNAETVLGEIFAETKEDAIEKVHQLDLVPIFLKEKGSSGGSSSSLEVVSNRRLSRKKIYFFTRQMTSLLKGGVPILKALEIIASQAKDPQYHNVVQFIYRGIRDGRPFSDCLAEHPKIFSSFYISMVKAGEESGRLKEILMDIANYLRAQEEMTGKIRMAMTYPLFMLVLGIGTVFFILTSVMPPLAALFVNLGQTLPLPTIIVMQISAFCVKWWGMMLVALFLLGLTIRQWQQTPGGRMAISQLKLSLPGLNDFWLKVELARFCRSLQLLLKSGISIVRALQLSVPVIDNQLIQKQLGKCQEDLVAGRSLSQSLQQAKLIPPMVAQLIMVGEEAGSLSETLEDIGESYEQETNEIIKLMTTLLEPLMILIVGAMVGFIVMAMLLPIFQLDVFAR